MARKSSAAAVAGFGGKITSLIRLAIFAPGRKVNRNRHYDHQK
jgi:hypothetical protein